MWRSMRFANSANQRQMSEVLAAKLDHFQAGPARGQSRLTVTPNPDPPLPPTLVRGYPRLRLTQGQRGRAGAEPGPGVEEAEFRTWSRIR